MDSNSIYILFPFVLMVFYFFGFLYGKSKNKENLILGSPGPGKVKSGFYDKENNYIRSLTFQAASLIHYQKQYYQDKFPKNAEIYTKIGKILWHISKPGNEFNTVNKLIEISSVREGLFCGFSKEKEKEFLNSIKNFNSIMLIELVSQMEKEHSDGNFLKNVQSLKEMYLLCKAPFNNCINLRVDGKDSCEGCLSISDKIKQVLNYYLFHYKNNEKLLLGVSRFDDSDKINSVINKLISEEEIQVDGFLLFKNENEMIDFFFKNQN